MKLLAIGDSFTYGEDLPDRNDAWPYVLGRQLGYEVTNRGVRGIGNDYMVLTAVQEAKNYDLVVIAWSSFARMVIADEYGIFSAWPGARSEPWLRDAPWRKDIINYFNRYYDDTYLYQQHLTNIVLLQQYFKSTSQRYIMLDAFLNNQMRHLDTELQKQIDPTYYPGWPNETMSEWTYNVLDKNEFATPLPGQAVGHFLAPGHQVVADKIYEHIRHLGWLS